MKSQEEAMLKALLVHSKHAEELIRFFPPHYGENLEKSKGSASTDLTSLFSSTDWLKPIHYSWIYPPLIQIPEDSRSLFFPLLTPPQLKGVASLFQKELKGVHVNRFVAPYLTDCLKKMILDEGIVEPALLPSSKMNILLTIRKSILLHIIDLLGIYDLAQELRKIVDKELLGKIYAALSREQLQFLHYASKQTSKWAAPKLKLVGWNGSASYLAKLLHQRGLIRLAIAMSDEDHSFCWHLLRHLDTGRAGIIIKAMKQKNDPELIPYFKGQLLHILKRYQ